VAEARKIVKSKMPGLIVDGEMTAGVALNKEMMKENYPFSELVDQDVNTMIFPNLASGNIAYNLLKELEVADAVGPILLGLKKPVHVLQLGSSVRSIINMAQIAVVDAQIKSKISIQEIIKRSPWWKRLRKEPK
jgi:malate dehydrogenase (oxaloacetate-decarboxylating)(NADP+)